MKVEKLDRPGACNISPARLDFVWLSDPYKVDEKDPGKYQVTILIPKTETEAVKTLRSIIAEVTDIGKVTKWNQSIPANLKEVLHDGDERQKDPQGIYKGCWYLTAKSARQVPVFNRSKLPITNPDELYSGMWGAVNLAVFPYKASGSCGLAAGLNAVMKLRDDVRLSGGGPSADVFDNCDFGDVSDDDL